MQLRRQAGDTGELETVGNTGIFVPALFFDLVVLALEIARILHADLHLFGHFGVVDAGPQAGHMHQCRVVEFGALEQIERGAFAAKRDAGALCEFATKRIVRRGPDG